MALRLGGTVAELKWRMSAAEFYRWIKYRGRYGAMDDRRVYDRPAAVIASTVARTFGGTAKEEDFMPNWKPMDDGTASKPQDLIAVFGGMKKGKRKR